MTALHDLNLIALVDNGFYITPARRSFAERRQRVESGERPRSSLNAFRLRCYLPADVIEQLRFQMDYSFFGAQDFLFPVAQFRRGEAFGVRQRLPALILGGDARSVALGHFNEIAEDVVELDTQVADTAASA